MHCFLGRYTQVMPEKGLQLGEYKTCPRNVQEGFKNVKMRWEWEDCRNPGFLQREKGSLEVCDLSDCDKILYVTWYEQWYWLEYVLFVGIWAFAWVLLFHNQTFYKMWLFISADMCV